MVIFLYWALLVTGLIIEHLKDKLTIQAANLGYALSRIRTQETGSDSMKFEINILMHLNNRGERCLSLVNSCSIAMLNISFMYFAEQFEFCISSIKIEICLYTLH